jgi:site-specific DNA-methyltransferase (adenine-specific)
MDPFYRRDNISLYSGDLRLVVPQVLQPNSVDFVCADPPYGYEFMQAEWDYEVPGPEYWRIIGSVCKPGAILLAFGGTRTCHRLTCAIEDAGWEIRDGLMWLYGQGMPKCGDIGKLIDKSKGAEREVVGSKLDRPGYHLHEGKGNGCYGGGNGLHAPGTDARLRAAQITAPATPEAARWTGWAMALKPAWEPIVLAMKPLDGTIAHNALTWGVAGMNIEASRIAADDHPGVHKSMSNGLHEGYRRPWRDDGPPQYKPTPTGRWPANLLLDEEAAALLDAQAGGVSRFFYCAKASRSERNPKGLKNDHATVKPLALMEYLLTLCSSPTGGVILDPFAGSGTTLVAARNLGRICIGVELSDHNCEIARQRISEL